MPRLCQLCRRHLIDTHTHIGPHTRSLQASKPKPFESDSLEFNGNLIHTFSRLTCSLHLPHIIRIILDAVRVSRELWHRVTNQRTCTLWHVGNRHVLANVEHTRRHIHQFETFSVCLF